MTDTHITPTSIETGLDYERIEFVIASNIDHMHGVLNYLMDRMLSQGLIDTASNLFVALDEAIANAIKHGNRNDPEKLVSIVAELTPAEATFTITDEGDGFDHTALPDPTDPNYIMRPCGRGVMLIYHLMDEVRYNTRGNQVVMIKRPGNGE